MPQCATLRPMSTNQIESAKENINFLTRTMLAYIAGVYLLLGAVGNYLTVWFVEKGDIDTVPATAVVCAIVLSLEVARLQLKIRGLIKQIGETP